MDKAKTQGNTSKIAVVCIVIISFFIVFLVWTSIKQPYTISPLLVCQVNLKGLGVVIFVYVHDNEGRLPAGNNWCDEFVMEVDVPPATFICKKSGDKYGESSYCLNENAAGKILSDLPGDMVLLFEVKHKDNVSKRDFPVIERLFASDFNTAKRNQYPGVKVYKDRWNQVGGVELLSLENHGGEGCNVLFVDGSAMYVRKDDIDKLKWKD